MAHGMPTHCDQGWAGSCGMASALLSTRGGGPSDMFAALVGLSVEASAIKPTGGQGVSGGPLLRVESRAEAILHYLV